MKWLQHALGAPGRAVAAVWSAMLAAAPVRVWLQAGAAMALTLVLVGGGWVIWRGGWFQDRQEQQLDALFYLLVGVEVLMLVALAAITQLNVNVRGGRDGVSASIDQDEAEPLAPMVRTVTETTVVPQPTPPADTGELPPEERIQK